MPVPARASGCPPDRIFCSARGGGRVGAVTPHLAPTARLHPSRKSVPAPGARPGLYDDRHLSRTGSRSPWRADSWAPGRQGNPRKKHHRRKARARRFIAPPATTDAQHSDSGDLHFDHVAGRERATRRRAFRWRSKSSRFESVMTCDRRTPAREWRTHLARPAVLALSMAFTGRTPPARRAEPRSSAPLGGPTGQNVSNRFSRVSIAPRSAASLARFTVLDTGDAGDAGARLTLPMPPGADVDDDADLTLEVDCCDSAATRSPRRLQ